MSVITISDIYTQVPGEVVDYQQLMALLSDYAKPRDRLSAWLARGDLIRVRKGLYVMGAPFRRHPVCRERLANLIYGPSYVSMDYALSLHGLIPERVDNVTSTTLGRTRRFETPLGVFTYQSLPSARYAPGIDWAGEGEERYLLATPEKALVDKIWADKRVQPASRHGMEAYLIEDLRLDESRLAALDNARLADIARAFDSRKIDRLVRHLAWRGGGRS